MAASRRLFNILLVEDNEDDVILTQQSLSRSTVASELHVARDGNEAMQLLRNEAPFESKPRPSLILLDLNLPKKDGRQVLAEIKEDDNLKDIPVVVLTTSQDEHDIAHAYKSHANAYLVKPVDFKRFAELVESLCNHWFRVVTLP